MSSIKHRIILVEDSTDLGYLLTEYLKMKDFEVKWFTNGMDALKIIEKTKFDLAILDVTMPGMDGFSLAEKIKEKHEDLPFLFLTARSLKVDVLRGFYLGAVDYLKKPIDEEELVIRIKNLLSRMNSEKEVAASEYQFKLGKYILNSMNQELLFENEVVRLTTKESELLKFLVVHKNELCGHKDILIKLWGRNDIFNKKSLNVFITKLRKYLEKDSTISINNIHGQGFIFRIKE
ncbi:response regulator transcription factor [Maribacter sp. X9]|uniref:response regulator transcription factor n=1 Tax=Maribacter sp. X9 TaxID=3402159 RepID=UPI003AF3501E